MKIKQGLAKMMRPRHFGQSEVHVWHASLGSMAPGLLHFWRMLSPDERQRASRFHFPRDRCRYIAAHGWLRQTLASYLDLPATEIRFVYGPQGKPAIDAHSGCTPLQFNLSHSVDLALIAISQDRAVGVDLERIRPEFATPEIARRFFSWHEQQALASLPAELWLSAFFKCWSCKEAYLKGIGVGLTLPLDTFDVSVDPRQPAALLRSHAARADAAAWALHDIDIGAGFAAALAVHGPPVSIRMMR